MPALGPYPQAFLGLPRELYDAMPGWNGSLLKIAYKRTPAHAWAAYRDPLAPQREDTDAFRIGSLVHAAILEPERFLAEYVVLPPDAPRRPTDKQLVDGKDSKPGTKANDAWLEAQARQKWWAMFDTENAGCEVITAADYELVDQLSSKVLKHPGLQPFFAGPNHAHSSQLNELTLTWLDPETGHRCKARIDALRYLGQALQAFELKSAQDGGPEPFGTAVVRYDYLLAAAFYHDAIDHCRGAIAMALGGDARLFGALPIRFEYVVCEKGYPFLVSRYEVDDDQLSIGRRQYREALDKVTTAEELDYWPGYDQAAVPLVLPVWFERMAAE
jgi:exodeoxyribonuclease VIII